ncbi:DEAD/DEAH box helicase family protein [Methylobacterium nodulans]|uniref:Helicase/UvrB N-terminal domain-containing protein n=1 Tax=Methylobacterium nodulans (strain LMG 21967 / CNCM I-2342 / ORS 2060) TaxID=460265 RepID=B8IPD1_METNO|nr:DEAD/DEAH box helicase family protein [Methylobacterium nodulans]ACL62223.1 conserved hypothetical protein [Methylobacterium nodulans ORS 2060]
MTDTAKLVSAFWRIVEKQTIERGNTLSDFSRSVAQSILDAGMAAYDDRDHRREQYRVVSAPTGSGKSSYAWALLAALIEAVPGSSAVFLCETINQCEDTYRELLKLVDAGDLAIWTSAHDAAKSLEDIERAYHFTPSAQFRANDLPDYRVIVVTHKFYKGTRGALSREYNGEDRTLTIIDEKPSEVAIFDIDVADVMKVREWALAAARINDAFDAFTALRTYLEDVWELERTGPKNYRALQHSDLTWFSSEQANRLREEYEGREAPDLKVASVIGFAQALASGFAFMSRYQSSSQGGRFVGYKPDLPIRPGTVLLDATSDIDGVAQIAPWRMLMPAPQLSFENLTVAHLVPPAEVIKPGERVSQIVKKYQRAEPYARWIKQAVCENTDPGEKVLVVVQKAMLDHNYLPGESGSFGDDAYDLNGRKVAFINWGTGIGSNRWKDATSVFLFGEFHLPQRATVGTALGILNEPAGACARLSKMGSSNSRDEVFLTLREGHLLRWEKQLAMRGNARNITSDGVCGRQKLFVTSEFSRFLLHKDGLFPGATFTKSEEARKAELAKGGAKAVATLLATTDRDCITSLEVQDETRVSLQKHASRILASEPMQAVMAQGGWTFVRGRGRGNPSKFVRAAVSQQADLGLAA